MLMLTLNSLYFSTPNMPTSPDGPTPQVPVRRESCKSLVIGSQPDDESIRRRNEIISSAARTSIIRKSSLNTSATIGTQTALL